MKILVIPKDDLKLDSQFILYKDKVYRALLTEDGKEYIVDDDFGGSQNFPAELFEKFEEFKHCYGIDSRFEGPEYRWDYII